MQRMQSWNVKLISEMIKYVNILFLNMQLFLVFILQIICSESHQKEINCVLYNIMFHSPASPYLCARVHLCSAHTEDAVFAASVLQLHTANVAWVHKSTVLLLNSMTQIVLFFFFTCIHRWILYTVYIYTMNIQLQTAFTDVWGVAPYTENNIWALGWSFCCSLLCQ